MSPESSPDALVEFLLRLGDDALVAGLRVSEWCGHAPILEEDIALANMALDCVGTANSVLSLAGVREGKGRSADDLAYFRGVLEFRNLLMLEQPNGDFAFTILKQFLYSSYELELYTLLSDSKDSDLAGISARTVKERRYHARHCGEWLLRLGLGTDESHARAQEALNNLWGYTDEFFVIDDVIETLVASGTIPQVAGLQSSWLNRVETTLGNATLKVPEGSWQHSGGRVGRHSEYLGHLLDEMQVLARSYPDASW
ncbi:MAG: phenylacetate-CoA oxygenase subunit PaaC [Rhodothermales bacterium]|nr:phenylacetate-CoA oxygenase subunit PaaC [Rhodothermales bacterium]